MLIDKIDAHPLFDGTAEIVLHTRDMSGVKSLMDKYVEGKEYTAEIKRKRARRSLDANAYLWVLCHKLAEVMGAMSDEDIYRQAIRDYGVSDIRPVKIELADELCRMWDAQGMGNGHTRLGESKLAGYENIKFYWGSSQYNTADMSRLIDGVVSECKEQGIETMTPDELEQIKTAWGR